MRQCDIFLCSQESEPYISVTFPWISPRGTLISPFDTSHFHGTSRLTRRTWNFTMSVSRLLILPEKIIYGFGIIMPDYQQRYNFSQHNNWKYLCNEPCRILFLWEEWIMSIFILQCFRKCHCTVSVSRMEILSKRICRIN